MGARVGKLSVDLEADGTKFSSGLSDAERAITSMQSKATEFVGRIDGAFDSVTKSAKTSAKAIEAAFNRQRDSMQQLVDFSDPAAAALRKLAQTEAQVNAAFASGSITASEHALILKNLSRISGVTGKGFASTGILVQQAGYQIADVASVAAAGGNAFAAVGTQLGQFLGFMGPMGAVVGAAVTILGLMATKMMDVGSSSDAAQEEIKQYENAVNALLNIEKEYNDILRERAGLPKFSDDLDALKKIAIMSQNKVDMASNSLSTMGGMWSSFKQSLGFSRTKTDYESAQAKNNLSQSDYTYGSEISNAAQEQKLQQILSKLNDEIDRENALMAVSASARERVKVQEDAELKVREALKNTIANPDEVNAQVAAARQHAAAVYDQKKAEDDLKKSTEDSLRAQEKSRAEQEKQKKAHDDLASSMDYEIDDNNRLIAALKISEEQYKKVNEQIQDEKKLRSSKVAMTEDDKNKVATIKQQVEQIDELKKKSEEAQNIAQGIGNAFSTSFADAIIEGKKLSDILNDLYKDLLRFAIQQTITQPLTSALSGSGIISSLSDILGFASGTNSAPPGMAWVGENGPELVNFGGGEKVYPSALSQRIAASWAIPGYADGIYDKSSLANLGESAFNNKTEVNIINNSGAAVSTKQNSANGGMTLDVMIDQAVAKNAAKRGSATNKAIRQTYSVKENLVRR